MENLIEHLRKAQGLAKLVGEAPAFQEVIRKLPATAKSEATVLISGETGTGKELVARAVHYMSDRAAMPFVPVNCGSLPDTLLEDELFGHERGAFTDAHAQRCGLIVQAEKGTLFLDEVEALSERAQVTLLRVLQDKKFRAIGSSQEQKADIRIVAATNASLDELIQTGKFRADLYYRLHVLFIDLPPLRERKQDIILLARHFLKKHTPPDRNIPRLSPHVKGLLLSYDWPGNVRQLENAVLRAIHVCQNNTIGIEDLGIPTTTEILNSTPTTVPTKSSSFKTMKQKVIEAFENDYLKRLMQEHHGNVTRAALAAGKERRDLGKMLKKYRINPKRFHNRPG